MYPKDHRIYSQRELDIKEQHRPQHFDIGGVVIGVSIWIGDTGEV